MIGYFSSASSGLSFYIFSSQVRREMVSKRRTFRSSVLLILFLGGLGSPITMATAFRSISRSSLSTSRRGAISKRVAPHRFGKHSSLKASTKSFRFLSSSPSLSRLFLTENGIGEKGGSERQSVAIIGAGVRNWRMLCTQYVLLLRFCTVHI